MKSSIDPIAPPAVESADPVDGSDAAAPRESQERDFANFFQVLSASFAYARGGNRATPASIPASRRAKAPKQQGAPSRRRLRWLSALFILIVGCVALVKAAALLTSRGTPTVPEELLGKWKSSVARYQDRGFSISRTSLTINAGTGGTEVSIHQITGVRVEHRGEAIIYTVTYMLNGSPYEFSVRRTSSHSPVLHLNNQLEVAWSREGGGG